MSLPWFLRSNGIARPTRLYCFPHAGGGAASFLPWQTELAPNIEICALQLPGRGARFSEVPYECLTSLARELTRVIANHAEQPFSFFGHSMGALLAFEITRCLAASRLSMPTKLFVSGSDAPAHRDNVRRLHELEDDELIAELESFNGTPLELLKSQEMMALTLPALRADFAMVADYKYRPAPQLSLPIVVLAGTADEQCNVTSIEAWQTETQGSCHVHWFDGDHFFIDQQPGAVTRCIRHYLAN